MAPGWDWDFEDRRPARGAATPKRARRGSAPPGGAGGGGRNGRRPGGPRSRARIRRRRAAVVIVGLALIAVLAIVLSGSGRGTSRATTGIAGLAHAAAKVPAAVPEDNQDEVVASVLRYTPFVKEGGSHGDDVALTFDDGPGPYTPRVLTVLEDYHVHATFFAIGAMERYFSASTIREIRDGDVIGDHTETHPMMAQLSAADQHEELYEQIARIELLGGQRPVLFRPPYGSFDATTMNELHKLHLLMVLWSVDTDDYQQPGVAAIVERSLAGAHPGAIILLHDAGGTRTETIEALPAIIRGIRAKGLRLVTVPQLLRDDPPPAGQPLPPNLSGD